LRRTTGRGVAQLLREDFADIDLHCALAPGEMARTAYMPKPPKAPDLGALTELKRIAFLKPWSAAAGVSREAWMAAEIPSSNMHGTARALAELAHPFADRGRHRGATIIGDAVLAEAFKERIVGDDLVLPFRLSWAAGMMRNVNGHFGPNPSALGHAGFGGSSVMVDPEHRLSAAYVMNKMSPHLVGDPRGLRLVNAVYDGL
ncbi:MAG: serine hydrolase domain-containing protein, partial [Parvularculaceae bacterium]